MKEAVQLWIVGKVHDAEGGVSRWEFQGVFSTKEAAIAACRTRGYGIGPAVLNAEIPDDILEWPGWEYPLCEAMS